MMMKVGKMMMMMNAMSPAAGGMSGVDDDDG